MKYFIVYDKEGNILRTGSCQNSTFLLQAQEGEFVIEGKADQLTDMVVDGKVVSRIQKGGEDK